MSVCNNCLSSWRYFYYKKNNETLNKFIVERDEDARWSDAKLPQLPAPDCKPLQKVAIQGETKRYKLCHTSVKYALLSRLTRVTKTIIPL